MGQYHGFASQTAGETLLAHHLGSGLKLMEWATDGFGGPTSAAALFLAPGGRWHDHRVVVVGDYAEVGDFPAGTPFATDPGSLYQAMHRDDAAVSEYAKGLVGEAFGVQYANDMFSQPSFDDDRMVRWISDTRDDRCFGPLYVVNKDKNQYLDPLAFGAGRNLPAIALRHAGVMMATAVLLAVSNGRGGGDLDATDQPAELRALIGSWGCDHLVLGQPDVDARDLSAPMKELLLDAERSWLDPSAWEPGSVPAFLRAEVGRS